MPAADNILHLAKVEEERARSLPPPTPIVRLARTAELDAVAIGVFAIESAGLYAFSQGRLSGLVLALIHGGLVTAMAIWIAIRRRGQWGMRMPALLMLTVAATGPFGAAGTLLTLLLHAIYRRSASTFESWYMSLFPEDERSAANDLYDLLATGREVSADHASVASFTDVLSFGSTEQKQAVIALLARHFRPAFAPALKQALADTNPAIRVQAATAAAQIEGEFHETSVRVEDAARKQPRSFEAHWALARHLDDYAFSGLLDMQRASENRARALEAYRHCLEIEPNHAEARAAVARILMREGRIAECETWIEQAIADNAAPAKMLDWQLECLYRLGRYDELRQAATRRADVLAAEVGTPQPVKEAVDLWAGRAQSLLDQLGERRGLA
jgi:hypothetical protein